MGEGGGWGGVGGDENAWGRLMRRRGETRLFIHSMRERNDQNERLCNREKEKMV